MVAEAQGRCMFSLCARAAECKEVKEVWLRKRVYWLASLESKEELLKRWLFPTTASTSTKMIRSKIVDLGRF